MYGILFDQTYINMVIFGLIVFFIMFLWRKITVMEGNMFILEKRVDMMKKSDRKDSINKNFESLDKKPLIHCALYGQFNQSDVPPRKKWVYYYSLLIVSLLNS